MNKTVILFGGTFDPVHIGHTLVAADAAEQLEAVKVYFIPAKRSPHKKQKPEAGDVERVEMLLLAIEGEGKFAVDDCELSRAAPSYTLDTVRYFRRKLGDEVRLCWLVGADVICELGKWYHVKELIDECDICVMRRGGYGQVDFSGLEETVGLERIEKLQKNVISTKSIEISSSEIRRRLGKGEPVEGMVDERVLGYICEKRLYGHLKTY